VLATHAGACEQRVLVSKGERADGALDDIGVDSIRPSLRKRIRRDQRVSA
jgi:hypothetical protein